MRNQTSSRLLIYGFTAVLFIVVIITVISLLRMALVNKKLDILSEDYSRKLELVHKMRTAARERSISLHKMVLTRDPFERDEEYLNFVNLGGRFASTREQFFKLPLNEEEKTILSNQSKLSRISVPLQNRVIDLILAEQYEQASQILLSESLPAQNNVLVSLGKLVDLEYQYSRETIGKIKTSNEFAYVLMIFLAGAALAASTGIAAFVTRRVSKMEQDLFQEKERVEVTLHSIGDAVITTDANGFIDYLNPVAEHLTGWSSANAQKRPLLEVFNIINESDRTPAKDPVEECLTKGDITYLPPPTLLISRTGHEFSIEDSAAPIRNGEGDIIGAVLVFHDVSLARKMAKQLSWQASHDVLTGLANRREFERKLEQLIYGARNHNEHHALCYLDLDQFKIVNDTCGHVAGDELLRQLGIIFTQKLRKQDTLARLGGDEFGILLESCNIDEAKIIAEHIRKVLNEFRFLWKEQTFEIGASIGVVAISSETDSMVNLLSTADAACYVAKEKGRNRIHIYQPGDQELAQRHGEMQWVSRITKAMEDNRFVLYAQPIKEIEPSNESGLILEILLRLNDEEGKLISPSDFFSSAERYAVTPTIDRWVVSKSFETLSHAPQGSIRRVAINLSGHTLSDDEFLDFLIKQFDNNTVEPEQICFEITETAAIANLSYASRFMSIMSELGCRFALDDFGSGLSSFRYLKTLPVDILKIDGAFVKDMVDDPIDRAMVEAINQIGHVMGLKTVAEFVENQEILDLLRVIGVDFAQGYGIAKPIMLESLLEDYLNPQKQGVATRS